MAGYLLYKQLSMICSRKAILHRVRYLVQ